MSKKKILIAAGGTGGHIYPALAVAEAFKRLGPDFEIQFVGTRHGLENKIIPPKGYVVHHLPIGRLNSNVSLKERVTTLLMLPFALIASRRLLHKLKPDFVLGVGGHASGPLLLMSALGGYRSAIWEPNAMPGMANRILSRFVRDAWVVFEEAKKLLHSRNMHNAGMPVRKEIEDMREVLTGEPGKFRILVFGGSQGARGLNTTVAEMLKAGGEWLKQLEVVHQTGAADFARIRDLYGDRLSTLPVDLREYLHDMENQYAQADLVICRSGTGTLSELAACGKPSILIPFPFAADDHQKKNAESLVAQGAALMIEQKNLTPQILMDAIQALQRDPKTLHQMSQNIRNFHRPRAAEMLAQEFLQRMN